MQTLEMHLAQLVAAGTISQETALSASLFPREITLPDSRRLVPAAR
jgi:Tfp pilus assembly pilus retraction ATPase PilT